MAGYSKNPLWKKLGIKEGYNCFLFQSPENYFELLEAIPKETEFEDEITQAPYDFEHVFVTTIQELESSWKMWKEALKKNGSLWVSWPKGGSKIETNLNGNIVREFGLKGGLVDVKVCAVDGNWSGLKFMYRKTDR
jgi:predicted SAM-dependent methyltransferase